MKEYRRLQELLKMIRSLRQLRETLENIRDIRKQRELLNSFREENEDWLRRLSPEELEEVREQANYDPKAWEEVLRQLLGEPLN